MQLVGSQPRPSCAMLLDHDVDVHTGAEICEQPSNAIFGNIGFGPFVSTRSGQIYQNAAQRRTAGTSPE